VKEVDIPRPAKGEVLIKIAAAPINPSDLARIRNLPADADIKTYIPGLEGSGTVVAAGKGFLPRLWLGRRVACSAAYPTSGTWAQYMVTPASVCFPLSRMVSDEQGSMSLVNPLTAISFFEIVSQNKHKSIINNAASGALGRMVELLGRNHHIPVINIVRKGTLAEKLRKEGSVFVLDSSDPSFFENLKSLSHDLGATLLFDPVCSIQLQGMIEALPAGSAVMIYGNLSQEEFIKISPKTLIDNDIKISGFYLGSRSKENGLTRNMLNLLKVRQLMRTQLKITIKSRFPLSEAQAAAESYIDDMSAGKILLIPDDSVNT
jgi:NADPH:quinone reductase-like Zn-dependent oxidoreductase